QLKANVTREFDSGYVRLNFKLLNDRAPVYLPEPISLTGSRSDPHVASLPDFDILRGAMQSPYFLHDIAVNGSGMPVTTDIRDGYYSNSQVLGLETAFDLGSDWKVTEKFRKAFTSGRFVGPYPGQVNTASALANGIGGSGATLAYATGPLAGQLIPDPSLLNGNGLAMQ